MPTPLSIDNQKLIYSGFSFLELLIVMVTMSLLFSIGFANYRDYQQRQALINATRIVKGDLRFAQEQALAGIKPAGCGTLNGYKLQDSDAKDYSIIANCDANVDYVVKSLSLSDKSPTISFVPTFSNVFFNVLGRGVKIPLTITLQDTKTLLTQQINITRGGEIN